MATEKVVTENLIFSDDKKKFPNVLSVVTKVMSPLKVFLNIKTAKKIIKRKGTF